MFIVTRNGRFITQMEPERRVFKNPPEPVSKVAIHTNPVGDLYATLGAPDGKGGYVVHVFHNPLTPWLFLGAVLTVLGGVVSLTDRHHRIGAPLRKLAAKVVPRAARAVPPGAVPAAGSVAAANPAAIPVRKASRGWVFVSPLVVFALLAAFFIQRLHLASQGDAPNLIPSVLIDKPAPAFDLPPLQAGESGLKTADLRGKVTLVNFFASWCGPCRDEHPLLSQFANTGINLVGVNYKDQPEDAKAVAGGARQSLPHGRGRRERTHRDRLRPLWRAGEPI